MFLYIFFIEIFNFIQLMLNQIQEIFLKKKLI